MSSVRAELRYERRESGCLIDLVDVPLLRMPAASGSAGEPPQGVAQPVRRAELAGGDVHLAGRKTEPGCGAPLGQVVGTVQGFVTARNAARGEEFQAQGACVEDEACAVR